ncbi:MAG: hypothetical protein Q8T13_11190 [Acidobacteriota bacterium]|nr:hypothetical protein [Acidobacteriota bacterium]
MTQHDHLLRQVRQLTVLKPDDRRAERLRTHCRARLAPRPSRTPRHFGPAAFAGLCLLYLSAIVYDVLQVQGLL